MLETITYHQHVVKSSSYITQFNRFCFLFCRYISVLLARKSITGTTRIHIVFCDCASPHTLICLMKEPYPLPQKLQKQLVLFHIDTPYHPSFELTLHSCAKVCTQRPSCSASLHRNHLVISVLITYHSGCTMVRHLSLLNFWADSLLLWPWRQLVWHRWWALRSPQ